MYLLKKMRSAASLLVLAGVVCAQGIDLNVNDPSSIKKAAAGVAANMMKYYTGYEPGQIPGELPAPYYWWEAGAMFGQLIHYWNLTGDTTYNAKVKQALLFQIGEYDNYMPSNQSSDLGNDDQSFWSFSAMDAAEYGFSNPDPSQYPSWLALAQAVFNTQVPRWETTTCGGGLRWQIYPFNSGYTYKNAVATGGLFHLSARLARYTHNQTYVDWAEKTWDWMFNSAIMNQTYTVYDGTYMSNNCSGPVKYLWTYNVGTMMMGAAYIQNQSSVWGERVAGLVNGSNPFFVQSAGQNNPPKQAPPNGNIMAEIDCEFPQPESCDQDMPSFKAYLSRWMAITAQLAPFTQPIIVPRLQASAMAAANQCAGQGINMCGRRWYQQEWDGFFGVGEQMSALSIMQNNLVLSSATIEKVTGTSAVSPWPGAQLPLSAFSGGTSKSDPSAGTSGNDNDVLQQQLPPITAGDTVGASILTILGCLFILGTTGWIVMPETPIKGLKVGKS